MEDALVNFVVNGKLSFKDFAKSVIADLARIQARAAISGLVQTGINFAGSLIGRAMQSSYGGIQGSTDMAGTPIDMSTPVGVPVRASGGVVEAGFPYLVGERGGRPELFVPEAPGRIIPDNMLGGRGGDVNVSTIVYLGGRKPRRGRGAMVAEYEAQLLVGGLGPIGGPVVVAVPVVTGHFLLDEEADGTKVACVNQDLMVAGRVVRSPWQ